MAAQVVHEMRTDVPLRSTCWVAVCTRGLSLDPLGLRRRVVTRQMTVARRPPESTHMARTRGPAPPRANENTACQRCVEEGGE